MKNIAVLGSTGSIGTQALDVASADGGINIVALSANSNVGLLEMQARKFKPHTVCICDKTKYADLKSALADTGTEVIAGEDSLSEISCHKDADMTLTSVVGNVGLVPTIDAIKAKKRILLANKETLVTGGEIIVPLAGDNGVEIVPVDSEHCAVFQCLQGSDCNKVSKILLTCSGGPFFGKKSAELEGVSVEQTLNHPKWSMGAKITVDSATLMNKGLEVIEAKWLFGVDIDDVEVYIHRQSIVHSMVEFVDGSVLAQLGVADMRLPISYAINYPERKVSFAKRLNLFEVGTLTFEKPDYDTFKCLSLAIKASKAGGVMPAAMNGANEVAVAAFLGKKIGFNDIARVVSDTMEHTENEKISVSSVLKADKAARQYAENLVDSLN